MTEQKQKKHPENANNLEDIKSFGDPEASLALARKLSRNKLRMQKKEEEIEALESELENFPENADVLSQLGKLYFEVGRTEEARNRLEKAARVFYSKLHIFKTLAGCYKKQGDKEMAVAAYRVYLAYDNLMKNLSLEGEAIRGPDEESVRDQPFYGLAGKSSTSDISGELEQKKAVLNTLTNLREKIGQRKS
jgi:tetratricopeptide (TPR) repeat protein